MRRMTMGVLVAILLVGHAVPAAHARRGAAPAVGPCLGACLAQLDLSEEQRAQLEELRQQMRAEVQEHMRALRQGGQPPDWEARQELLEKFGAALDSVLTDEQLAQLALGRLLGPWQRGWAPGPPPCVKVGPGECPEGEGAFGPGPGLWRRDRPGLGHGRGRAPHAPFAGLELTEQQRATLEKLREQHRLQVEKLLRQQREELENVLTKEQRGRLEQRKNELYYGPWGRGPAPVMPEPCPEPEPED